MFISRSLKHLIAALFFVALTVQFSDAATTITVEQSGIINGSGMDGITGIDLTIKYNVSQLSSPTVTKGSLVSRGMLAANTVTPGVIRIAIISTTPFSGDGQIAAINFASNSGKGGINPESASILDTKEVMYAGVPTSAAGAATVFTFQSNPTDPATTGLISEPGIPFSQTTSSTQTKTQTQNQNQNPTPTQNPSSSTTGYTNTVTIQTDTLQTTSEPPASNAAKSKEPESTPQQQTQPDTVPPPQTAVSNDKPAEKKTDIPRQQVVFKSVVERFKAYIGDKSLPIMAALFRKEVSQFIRQEPAVALSNGKSRVKITIDLPTHIATSPNFALNDATLLSVKREAGHDRRWIIEALPYTNSWKSFLIIIAGDESFEYPLTVAPAIANGLKLDESSWNALLKTSETAKLPINDYNHDGLHDHIDEFIFVANYLAAPNPSPGSSK